MIDPGNPKIQTSNQLKKVKALASLARCGTGGGEEDPPDQMDEFFAGQEFDF
jgi:hypothetical protein